MERGNGWENPNYQTNTRKDDKEKEVVIYSRSDYYERFNN